MCGREMVAAAFGVNAASGLQKRYNVNGGILSAEPIGQNSQIGLPHSPTLAHSGSGVDLTYIALDAVRIGCGACDPSTADR